MLQEDYERLLEAQRPAVRASRLFDIELPVWQKVLISLACMALLVLAVVVFTVPNPNMILITGLVIFSTLFGIPGGVVAAAVMMGYTLYFFSIDHSFVSFTAENLAKVMVTAIGVSVVGVFVCALKGSEDEALHAANSLARMLSEDNELLERASTIDILTGLRNRFALRRDYQRWTDAGEDLYVMMLDLDNFKGINDEHGHEQGDDVLAEMGRLLLTSFGPARSYRYGGDEFLVIASDWTESMFSSACSELAKGVAQMSVGDGESVHFSAGYVSGRPRYQSDLRLMIRQADDKLYSAKHAGKDQVTGGVYERDAARKLESNGRAVRFGDRA